MTWSRENPAVSHLVLTQFLKPLAHLQPLVPRQSLGTRTWVMTRSCTAVRSASSLSQCQSVYAIVSGVEYKEAILRVLGDRPRLLQLARTAPRCSPAPNRLTAPVKLLHAMVSKLRNVDRFVSTKPRLYGIGTRRVPFLARR